MTSSGSIALIPVLDRAPHGLCVRDGGASRDRTDDLKLAKLALSQLSYGPIGVAFASMVGRVGVEPTTSRLSGVRSNHLSYRPPLREPIKAVV